MVLIKLYCSLTSNAGHEHFFSSSQPRFSSSFKFRVQMFADRLIAFFFFGSPSQLYDVFPLINALSTFKISCYANKGNRDYTLGLIYWSGDVTLNSPRGINIGVIFSFYLITVFSRVTTIFSAGVEFKYVSSFGTISPGQIKRH